MFYLIVIFKLLLSFIIIMFYLNISGKKRLSSMTPINFVGNFIIGGIVGGAIYSNVPTYKYFIIFILSIFILFIVEYLAKKIAFLKETSIGHPIPIIKNGQILIDVVNNPKYNINMLNVAKQLRLKGITNFDKVNYAQIETDGELTVITEKNEMPTWILLFNGNIMTYELEEIGKTKEWLLEKVEQNNIKDLSDIFLAKYYNHNLTFILNNGNSVKAL